MGISDAFLRGQQVRNQADAQRLGLLSALINRPMAKTGSAALRGGGGGGRGREPIESFEDQDARKAVEDRKARGQKMLEEAHGQAMESSAVETDIRRQAQTESETLAANKAVDRAKAEREDISAGQIREGSMQDTLDYQEQMRHYKAYYDAIYRGDAAGADRHFLGVYPGMGETSRTSVTRKIQGKKPDGSPLIDEKGNPVMVDSKQRYDAEGNKITEEQQLAKQMGYPKHRSDGGVVSLQFPGEAPRPVGDKILRQMFMSIHPSMMKQAGGEQGGGGQVGGGATSEKTTVETAYKKMQTGTALYKAAADIATKMPIEGEDVDLMQTKSAQQWQRDWKKALVDIHDYSNSGKRKDTFGLTGKTPLGDAMSKKAGRKAVNLVHKMRKDGFDPKLEQIEKSLLDEYGPPTAFYFDKYMGAAEYTPDGLPFTTNDPTKVPDFGNGSKNVLHYYNKEQDLGVAIDKTTGRPMYHDRNQKAWVSMDPAAQRAFITILNEKANEGNKEIDEMLELLNAHTQPVDSEPGILSDESIIGGVKKVGRVAQAVGRYAGGVAQDVGEFALTQYPLSRLPKKDIDPKSEISSVR